MTVGKRAGEILALLGRLARENDAAVIRDRFLGALNQMYAPLEFIMAGPEFIENDDAQGTWIPVETDAASLGRIFVRGDKELIESSEIETICGAASMLAILLEKSDQKLQQLQQYMHSIIDSMPSMIIGVDKTGTVTQWNKHAEDITGFPEHDAIGRNIMESYPLFTFDLERIRKCIEAQTVSSQRGRPKMVGTETRYEDFTVYPLSSCDDAGAVLRIDDVTERVRFEETLVQSEKMMSIGELAAGMAHEINNPLAGILQNAVVLSNRLTRRMPVDEKAAMEAGISLDELEAYLEKRNVPRTLNSIIESSKRAARIVSDMLNFARKSESCTRTASLTDLLDQTVELTGNDFNLQRKYDFRQIKIVREYDPNTPNIVCEPGKIQQVFFNILRNGAEAMQADKTKKPKFTLRINPVEIEDRPWVKVEIEDNGPGIPYDERKRIFEPFFTTKAPSTGTGLGLSVSYFIITENHHGRMSVKSIVGMGTTFVIQLPLGGMT